jgi:xanthine dehydrogenase accessory factor
LREKDIPPLRLARLTCPIGLPEITSKEPAAIAASVAADLLMRRERQFLRGKGPALHGF